ncbi:MAG: CPBP family intramembrane metalloprotease [Myxococcales bacterium]|nr:CPBP family intramembrane metalloprotease [Myxococcales bacterium]
MASPKNRRKGGATAPSALRVYLHETRTPLTAAALTLPLLVLYGLGSLVLPEARNGADLLTSTLSMAFATAGWVGWRPWGAFYGALLAINVGVLIVLRRRERVSWKMLPPLLVECSLYALLTGIASTWMTDQLLEFARVPASAISPWLTVLGATADPSPHVPPITGLVISAGAGLHEELVFRLGCIGLIARASLGPDWRHRAGPVVMLALVSSLVFAGVHHLAEPFSWGAMVFRTVAGLVFASLYLARGFAVAAWTHALYDVWILIVIAR